MCELIYRRNWNRDRLVAQNFRFRLACMNPNTSCGIGALHTGANDCRCSGEGPCSRSAARWRGVPYPLFDARP